MLKPDDYTAPLFPTDDILRRNCVGYRINAGRIADYIPNRYTTDKLVSLRNFLRNSRSSVPFTRESNVAKLAAVELALMLHSL